MKDVAAEIARSKALRLYIGNLMTQPGETRRYSAADHLAALHDHAGRKLFDGIVLSTSRFPLAVRRRYARQRAEPVVNDIERIRALGVEPIEADLLAQDHVARHDPVRLSDLLLSLAAKRQRGRWAGSKA